MTTSRPASVEVARTIWKVKEIIGSTANDRVLANQVPQYMRFIAEAKTDNPFGKEYKRASARFAQALHRLEIALKDPDLYLPWLPSDLSGFWDIESLKLLRKEHEAQAQTSLGKTKPRNEAQRIATQAAARLLTDHGLQLKLTRNGQFHKLAAWLYGDKDADLFEYCRKVKSSGEF